MGLGSCGLNIGSTLLGKPKASWWTVKAATSGAEKNCMSSTLASLSSVDEVKIGVGVVISISSARAVGFVVEPFFLCFVGVETKLLLALVSTASCPNAEVRPPLVLDSGFELTLELTLNDDITLGSSPSLFCTTMRGLAEVCSVVEETFGLGRSSVLVKIDKEDAGAFWKKASLAS